MKMEETGHDQYSLWSFEEIVKKQPEAAAIIENKRTMTFLDKNGYEVPQGETGEICIFGNGVSNGYAGDHDEENKVFVILPDGTRVYHSGDLGYILSDGNIGFLHRMDTQIMIYGKRVDVMEVESKLYQ